MSKKTPDETKTKSIPEEKISSSTEQGGDQDPKSPKSTFHHIAKSSLIASLFLLCLSGAGLVYYINDTENKTKASPLPFYPMHSSVSKINPLSKNANDSQINIPSEITKDNTSNNVSDIKNNLITPKQEKIHSLYLPTTSDIQAESETTLASQDLSKSIIQTENEKNTQPVKSEIITPISGKGENSQALKKPLDEATSEKPLSSSNSPTEPTKTSHLMHSANLVDIFTLKDALILRDHLNQGISCQEDYQRLLKSRIPGNLWNSLIEKLTPICVNNEDYMNEMTILFKKNKKGAMLAYYKQSNATWLAYLKAIGSSLIEIRNLNPKTEEPLDILSMVQDQLAHRNIIQAKDLIQKLPAEMKLKFQSFLKKATLYQSAQSELDQLILLFEGKGK